MDDHNRLTFAAITLEGAFHSTVSLFANPRVSDGLEGGESVVVGKNNAGKPRSIDNSLRHNSGKCVLDIRDRGTAGSEQTARNCVGINDNGATVSKDASYLGLPRPDTTR